MADIREFPDVPGYVSTKQSLLLKLHCLTKSDGEPIFLRQCNPLDQIVEVHRYVDLGHKKGDVVTTV